MSDDDTIQVIVSDITVTRGGLTSKDLEIETLSSNIEQFIEKIGKILSGTPSSLGNFCLDEFEVYATISTKGSIAILGTGGEVGSEGGLKFTFCRKSSKTT